MQQMTPEACAGGNTTGKQLIDSRDGKKYWIAKLRDGKCWMTQNLDLDLTNITLTGMDSDVTVDWTPNLMSELWSNDSGNLITRYYDAGNLYCNFDGCTLTSSANNGHDLQGNYYSWNAATAGTGNAVGTVGTAQGSVCPKGWRLPIGGRDDGEFFELLNGLAVTNITKSPYYFVPSGNVSANKMNSVGNSGYYWSSVAYSNNSLAYSMYFTSSSIAFSDSSRSSGNSVRCVAR